MGILLSLLPVITTPVIDNSLVGELVDLCETCMGLFTLFPLNVFLLAGLVGIGFTIFRMAKNASRG